MPTTRLYSALLSICLLLPLIGPLPIVYAQTSPEEPPPPERSYNFRERIESRIHTAEAGRPSALETQEAQLSDALPGGNPWDVLVFDHWNGSNFELYYVDSDPKKTDPPSLKRITNTTDNEIEPAFDPSFTQVLFSCQPVGDKSYNLFVMNRDGTNRKWLTTTPADNYDAVWSPDGKKIAFTSERDGQPELYVMNADGSGQKRLTTTPKFDGMPAWSPTGNKIVFVSARRGIPALWLINPDGASLTQLNNSFSVYPIWSPDGSKIVFSSLWDIYDYWYDILIFDVNKQTLRQLRTEGGYTDLIGQSWSPSGRYLNYIKEYYTLTNNQFYLDHTAPEALDMLDYDDHVANETYYQYSPDAFPNILTSLSTTILDYKWDSKDPILPQTSILPVSNPSPSPIQFSWNVNEKGGSGIERYQLRYKVPDNRYSYWNYFDEDVVDQKAVFAASAGFSASFQVRAIDKAGNVEPWKAANTWTPTIESVPPEVQFGDVKPYLPQSNVPIRFSGYDPGGSGIDRFFVSVRKEGYDTWQWVSSPNEPYYYFTPDTLGIKYYFQLYAVDKAGSVSQSIELPHSVTYYAWEAGGTLNSAYGGPVTGGDIQSVPAAMKTFTADAHGQYWVLGKEPDYTSYSLAWSKADYGSLPLTNLGAKPVFDYNVFLPPDDNSVHNWDFEAGQFDSQTDWTTSGEILPRFSWERFHTGAYSAAFGGLAQTTPIVQVTNTESWPSKIASIIDQSGAIHMVWGEGYQLFYAQKPQGAAWSAPEALYPNTTNPNHWPSMPYLKVDSANTLHVMWQDLNITSLNHRSRTSQGIWSEQVNVAGAQVSGKFSYAVSSTGQVHVAWGCYSAGRPAICYNKMVEGAWNVAEVLPPTPNPSRDPQLALDANDLPVVAWNDGTSPNFDVLISKRNSAGLWSTPSKATPAPVYNSSENAILWLKTFSDGAVQVGYSNLPQDQPNQFITRTLSAGGTWDAPLILEQTNDMLFFLGVFQTQDQAVHVAWQKTNFPNTSGASYRQYQPAGGWLPEETVVDSSGTNVLSAEFVVGQDNIPSLLFNKTMNFPSYSLTRRGENGVWSMPTLVFDTGGGLMLSNLQVDDAGNLYMTWNTNSESNHQIYYNERRASTQSGVSALSQRVTIPDAASSPGLSFLYLLWSSQVKPNLFTVTLDTGAGPEYLFDSGETSSGWQHAWVDLSTWGGQTGVLTFNLLTEAGQGSPWAFLDEVSLGSSYTDVWVDLQSSKSLVIPGADIDLDIHYGTYGPSADDVVIRFNLPAGMEFISASTDPVTAGNELTWVVGSLLSGSPAGSIQLKLRVPPKNARLEPFACTAEISTGSAELEKFNNQAQGAVDVHWSAYLPIMKNN